MYDNYWFWNVPILLISDLLAKAAVQGYLHKEDVLAFDVSKHKWLVEHTNLVASALLNTQITDNINKVSLAEWLKLNGYIGEEHMGMFLLQATET